ncbi:alpha/beta fold hydrolase [Chitinophaga filiformis]|uniref:Alpha/beta hydrolase n=1 Tax=Chitinophaga filiformis TaxID=104663 RepID=A0ABY4I3Z4_CHIFI|nr:alpha/beta hydrolase [Chitinophaga filiformis]UPK69451.1 alpha/beta hydrolase [Chitinophaga filiformis]
MAVVKNSFGNTPTQYIEIDGVAYAYRRLGTPAAVPLIGYQHFTGTLDNWDPVIIDGLAQYREVIVFDNRGVGNSGGKTPATVAEMTADAIAFASALGISRFDVLGFSLGGFIAQQLAVERPDLVRKMIIVGAAPQGAKVLQAFPQLIEKAMKLEEAERFLFIFFTASEESRAKGRATLQRLYARTEDRDRTTAAESVMAQLRAITAWGTDPVTIDLSKVAHPALIVQGSNDEMMDSDNSYVLFKQLPNAVLSYYPDAAHGSFFQYPELFVNEANFFLDRY